MENLSERLNKFEIEREELRENLKNQKKTTFSFTEEITSSMKEYYKHKN